MTKQIKKENNIIFGIAYYVYFSLFLFLQFMESTLIDISSYRQIIKFALLFFGILLIAKIALEWIDRWDINAILIAIFCIGGILLPVLNYIQDLNVAFCLLLLASRNMNSRKLLRLYVYMSAVLTIFVVVYCLTGHVNNFVVYRNASSSHLRQSLGFVYPTYLSAHAMGICSAWAYIRGKRFSWLEDIITVIIGCVMYALTEARITCAVIVVIALIMAIYKICCLKSTQILLLRKKIIKWILICLADIVAGFSIIMGIVYKNGSIFWEKLDSLLSGRLKMTAIAFQRHNISMWGQRITSVDDHINGETGIQESFFLLNNSFMETLFFLGISGLVAVLVGWTIISYRAAKHEEYYRLLILDSLVIYSFFEQRLLVFCVVPFWILLISDKDVEFFDFSFFKFYSKIKMYSKKIWLILTMAMVAFLIDIVAFNSNSIMTVMNEKINVNDISIDTFGLQEGTGKKWKLDYGSLKDDSKAELLLANIVSPIGIESFELGFNFYNYDDNGYYYVDDVDFSYDIYAINGEGELYLIKTVNCNSSKPITWFTKLDISTPIASLFIKFDFDKDYMFEFMNLDVNGPVPYDFNPGRLALIWLILSALALVLSSGKKLENKENDDVDGAVKEEKTEADDNQEEIKDESKDEASETESTTEAEKV